mgnify:CR=1 FL=1
MRTWHVGAIVVAGYLIYIIGNGLVQKSAAFAKAQSLTKEKGIVNLGAGPQGVFSYQISIAPEVVANVDIASDGLPSFIEANLEQRLPFGDKQFDVAFASHVLEHLENWRLALGEMQRVADFTVIVLPHPLSIGGWIVPEHKQHFSFSDIKWMRNLPNTFVFA